MSFWCLKRQIIEIESQCVEKKKAIFLWCQPNHHHNCLSYRRKQFIGCLKVCHCIWPRIEQSVRQWCVQSQTIDRRCIYLRFVRRKSGYSKPFIYVFLLNLSSFIFAFVVVVIVRGNPLLALCLLIISDMRTMQAKE